MLGAFVMLALVIEFGGRRCPMAVKMSIFVRKQRNQYQTVRIDELNLMIVISNALHQRV